MNDINQLLLASEQATKRVEQLDRLLETARPGTGAARILLAQIEKAEANEQKLRHAVRSHLDHSLARPVRRTR
jgi:hypothetical protein